MKSWHGFSLAALAAALAVSPLHSSRVSAASQTDKKPAPELKIIQQGEIRPDGSPGVKSFRVIGSGKPNDLKLELTGPAGSCSYPITSWNRRPKSHNPMIEFATGESSGCGEVLSGRAQGVLYPNRPDSPGEIILSGKKKSLTLSLLGTPPPPRADDERDEEDEGKE